MIFHQYSAEMQGVQEIPFATHARPHLPQEV